MCVKLIVVLGMLEIARERTGSYRLSVRRRKKNEYFSSKGEETRFDCLFLERYADNVMRRQRHRTGAKERGKAKAIKQSNKEKNAAYGAPAPFLDTYTYF